MNTKRIKELAALTDGELARKLLIQEFGNDSETHWGNNAHDERVMVTINPDGIAQRTWEADHWVRLDEFDKDGFYAREIYEGKWVDEPLPINVIARNVTIAAPKPIQQESKDTEILRAAQVLCKQLTGDDTFGWNPELLAQIADCTAALLATNGISSHFPSANTEPICVDANTPEDAIKKVQKALDANDAGTAMQLGENLSCALRDGGYQVTNAVEVDE